MCANNRYANDDGPYFLRTHTTTRHTIQTPCMHTHGMRLPDLTCDAEW